MGFTIEMRLEGVEEYIQALAGIIKNINPILKKALIAAARVIRDKARELSPVETKLLRKSIKVTAKAFRDKNLVIAWVGPDDDHKKEVEIQPDRVWRWIRGKRVHIKDPPMSMLVMVRNPARYAHLLEYGTKHTPAHPFLRPAFEQAKAEAVDAFIAVMCWELEALGWEA